MGAIVAAVPAPKASVNVLFFSALITSATSTFLHSTCIPQSLAISTTLLLVIPSSIVSLTKGVTNFPSITNITFMVPASSIYLCSLASVHINCLYPSSCASFAG